MRMSMLFLKKKCVNRGLRFEYEYETDLVGVRILSSSLLFPIFTYTHVIP